MLRTKQLGSLSQCARSFFLSGSRNTTADGASSTCSDDEHCISKKQSQSPDVLSPHKAFALPSKIAKEAGTALPRDPTGSVDCHKIESCGYPASVPHVQSTPRSSLRSADVTLINGDVHAPHEDFGLSSGLVADQLMKAGTATIGFLSDLVNRKLWVLDGTGFLPMPPNCMVDSTGSFPNVRSPSGKSRKADNNPKVHGMTSGLARGSTSSGHYHGPKGQAEKSTSMKGLQHVPNTIRGTSGQSQNIRSDTRDKRQALLPNSKVNSYRTTSSPNFTAQASEEKLATTIPRNVKSRDKVPQPVRNMQMQARAIPCASPPVLAARAIDHVYHILRQLKWGPASEEALGHLNLKFDAYQANQILKSLQDHSVALGFFYWLKRQAGFKHDEHSYTTMAGILGRARQFGAMRRLIDEMIRDGCRPNVVTYNRLIHSYGRANYIKEAVNVFYQMQEAGCQPDRVTYCTLIDIHAKAGYLEIAMDMYREMQEAGLSPDTFTYGVIINCLGKAGHLPSAYKLFSEMVEQGCVPNLVTYNIMIALQAKAHNYPSALKLYRDMQNAGFRPDMVTYSIVMEVLGHCGYLDEAEAVFAEMKRHNWVPDEPVYGLLIDLWGKAGNLDKARGWYQSMLNAGLMPNVPTCNSLLSAFLRAHRFSDAYDVLQTMLRLGLRPSLQTYTLLLSCCTDTQSSCDMWSCCELMSITGHPAHVFLLTLPAAEPDGQNVRDHASNFLDLMHSEDRESKRGLVDAVIDFLHKSGLKEEAGSVWEVAAQKNVYPDVVREKSASYWLINLHVMSDGTAVTALSRTLAWFRKQLLESGAGPNRIDIITGWGRRSRVTGSSMVRQSVQDLLHLFRFPFFTENGNSGCFVGCGESLSRWLLHSYVERMHLL